MNPRNRVSWSLVVWALVLAYALFFSAASIQKHHAFQTTDFDLGNLSQVVWNTLHGHPFLLTNPEGAQPEMSLGIHVWPILLLLAPLYLLWADPRLLLVVQSVVIALGAWPVYLLAKHATRHTPHASTSTFALAFALIYLLFPALQSANMFDFHPLALAPTLLLAAFYALERQRWGGFALWAGLAMACQEDVALMVGVMGLYAALIRRQRRAGLLIFVASVAWFAVAVGLVLPHFDTAAASPFASRYAYLGDTPWQMAWTMLTRPGVVLDALWTPKKLAYVRDLLAPAGFLSLLAPQVLVISLPPVLTNLLSTKDLMHHLEGLHYSVNAAPFVVVSAAYGAAWLAERFRRRAWLRAGLVLYVLVCSLGYHAGHGYTPLGANFRWPQVTDHHRLGEQMAHSIPAGASLSALPYLHPHASNRALIYAVNRLVDGRLARVDGVDYVWLDVTHSWPIHPHDLKRGVEDLLAGDYGVDQATDGWLLLRRGAPDKTLPDEFYTFARAADPRPQYPLQLQFLLDGQPILETLGFDLTAQSTHLPTCQLTFYWRALHPLPANLRLYPFYFDDDTGQILEDTRLRPLIATLWYPPERWPVGEIVQTSTMPWEVGDTFSVGLGVVQGDDWNNLGARLPSHVVSSELVVRLFDGDTWARLLHVADGQPLEEYRQFTTPSPQHPLHASFDNQILLLGYDLTTNPQSTNFPISNLTLYWQAQTRLDTSYIVFAQLLGPAGNARAQADRAPQAGGYPTPWWLPGEVVVDSLTLELPADAPRDVPYRLIVGLYDPRTGERLVVAETGADFVELITLQP